jgi:hypothetical protein
MFCNKIRVHAAFSDRAIEKWNVKGVWVSPNSKCNRVFIKNGDTLVIFVKKHGYLTIGVAGYGESGIEKKLELDPFYIDFKVKSNNYFNYSLSKKQTKWKIRVGKKYGFIILLLSKIAALFRIEKMEPAYHLDEGDDDTNVTIGDDDDG